MEYYNFRLNSSEVVTAETDSQGNRYYISSTSDKYISVTTLLKYFEDQNTLIAWRERVGQEEADAISKAAVDIGNLSHKEIESYLETGEVKEDYTSYSLNTIKHFYSKTVPIKFEEVFLYKDPNNPVLKYGGRFDQLLYLNEGFYYLEDVNKKIPPKYVIADLKTKRKSIRLDRADYIYKYCLQQAAYIHAINSLQDEPMITGGVIVVATKQSVKLLYLDMELVDYYWNIFYQMLLDYYLIKPLKLSWKELVSQASMYYDENILELSSKMPYIIAC